MRAMFDPASLGDGESVPKCPRTAARRDHPALC